MLAYLSLFCQFIINFWTTNVHITHVSILKFLTWILMYCLYKVSCQNNIATVSSYVVTYITYSSWLLYVRTVYIVLYDALCVNVLSGT